MPLEQVGQPIIFYAFYALNGEGALGLTVTVDVWEVTAAGVATEIVAAAAATEIGDGLYRYRLVAASVDEQAEYIAVFKTADACDVAHIPALWVIGKDWVEDVDAAISDVPGAVLSLDVATVEATASTNSLAEMILAAFESALAGVNWTIYQTDHLTVFNTRTVSTSAIAQPIIEVT